MNTGWPIYAASATCIRLSIVTELAYRENHGNCHLPHTHTASKKIAFEVLPRLFHVGKVRPGPAANATPQHSCRRLH
jgi:hypothetical protein